MECPKSDQSFECCICKKTFRQPQSFKGHWRTHSRDGLLLACDTCGREVIQSQGQGHTHETFCDDHFDCDKCNKQFADIQCLNEHKAEEHGMFYQCAKSKYFCEKIEHCTLSKNVKKSWSLINAISGRKRKSPSIKELLINDTIVSDDKVIAESFNDFFTNIGINLAAESDQLYNNLGDDPNFHQHQCPGTRFCICAER